MKKRRHHELQHYFKRRLLAISTKLNKIKIGWDEILAPGLPDSIIIQSWRGKEHMVEGAKLGYECILSQGYYLDLFQPAAFHYQNDPLTPEEDLTPEQTKQLLVAEAAIWSEFVSPENIDSRIWPRTAAIAERLWSLPSHCDLDHLDQRLAVVSLQLEALGLTHEKNYPMLLRRLTGSTEITSLKTLVDLCEPVKIYERVTQRSLTTTSPLTRVVDAARPDAETPRKFRLLVKAYLQIHSEEQEIRLRTEIRKWLHLWASNHTALEPFIKRTPILHVISSLSADLSSLAQLGLEALNFLEKESEAETVNLKQRFDRCPQELITAANKNCGQVELMVVDSIAELVKTAW